MNACGLTRVSRLTRRRFLQLAGASAAAVALTPAIPRRAEAATYLLHDDTNLKGQGKLYSGSINNPGDDTAESATCKGPGRLSCYWGALYVNSVTAHRLRTGPYPGSCSATWDDAGNTGNTDRVRWASHTAASVWTPEYRFVGRLYVYDIMAGREDPWTGLVLHPVHHSNYNNYFIRLWERDNSSHVAWGREVDDKETLITPKELYLPSPPQPERWYDYRVDVLPGNRLKFYWDGVLIFDATDDDPAFPPKLRRKFSRGPVGMRLDRFDTVLDETRVYKP